MALRARDPSYEPRHDVSGKVRSIAAWKKDSRPPDLPVWLIWVVLAAVVGFAAGFVTRPWFG
jgi:hypothetical protein